jgi:ribosome biogenesis SPOUT family RNA methylase Rps3
MTFYLIEHLEPESALSSWCRIEYQHVANLILSPNRLIFTNIQSEIIQNELLQMSPDGKNVVVISEPLKEAMATHPLLKEFKFSDYCLLDMKAEKALSPSDAPRFPCVVFGGILGNVIPLGDGNYSSDDKTALVRDLGFDKNDNRRHLGEMQMTTDTAVLVTRMIIQYQMEFPDIQFIDNPEIEGEDGGITEMEGFRYVCDDQGRPVLAPGMQKLLNDSMDWDLSEEL